MRKDWRYYAMRMTDPVTELWRLKLPRALGVIREGSILRESAGTVTAKTETGKPHVVHLQKWTRSTPPKGRVYVSSLGTTVRESQVLADHCIIQPDFREARMAIAASRRFRDKAPVFKQGTVFGIVYPHTYGDWFRAGLLPLCSQELRAPIIVPNRFIWEKDFARRDLARLGVEVHVTGEEGVFVEDPLLLTETGPLHHWLPGQADMIRKAFKITPAPARPGSLLYLSREGLKPSLMQRDYMSKCVEEIILELGGKVVRVKDTSFDQFVNMGTDAETVVADHGSALSNMTWWKPKKVVEILSTYWNEHFLTLAKSIGVEDYTYVSCVDKTEAQLQEAVRKALKK